MASDSSPQLPSEFFAGDPLHIAPALLGCHLVFRHAERGILRGRIVETEAYRGEEDLACHASRGRTSRTKTMYGPPGTAYIYLIYGMHHLLNVVAWPEGHPASILIRALEPLDVLHDARTDGPGRLTRAMGIDRSLNGVPMEEKSGLWLEKREPLDPDTIVTGPRVGVDYAGEWAKRPWRYWIRDTPYRSV